MQEKLWGCRQDLEKTIGFIIGRPDYRFDCMTDDLNAEEECVKLRRVTADLKFRDDVSDESAIN